MPSQRVSPYPISSAAHLHPENIKESQSAFLSPSSTRSVVPCSHQNPETPGHTYDTTSSQSWDKSKRSETHIIREAKQSQSSSTSILTQLPLQLRKVLLNINEGATSENRSPVQESQSQGHTPGEASCFEIHHPNPISPPNHECDWKDRYSALAAEIRLLKAELSTRVSLGGADIEQAVDNATNEDDDLGIQGVTIILHMKGKDDLVINTDLTEDVE
ncbi:uncharacterized protein F4822DRAFT_424347 [Hypoxylon trugodes]|uniref:uncharacterized protein n=1 Tax=Hypoxylon trugodes TaxID=326681 RepID=UPI00218E4421|nr:uncharacterized protein F4822DRAFT_424347 [Hypoxylon trugodes]KAI1393883.1 hypothetical protein F4822DRAFT_424347 [Hypoxylon trugodes]